MRLAERRGLVVKFWKVDRESLELRMEELEGVLSERTRLGLLFFGSRNIVYQEER